MIRVPGDAGTYRGIATTPWVMPYEVAFVIDSNGHYSAFNTSTTNCPALYYGTDQDIGLKELARAFTGNRKSGVAGYRVRLN